jgi:hypothetical protein
MNPTDERADPELHIFDERVHGIEDPVLRELALRCISVSDAALVGLSELVSPESSFDASEQQLDQSIVNSLVEELVAPEHVDAALVAGGLFAELDRITSSDESATTLLSDCAARLIAKDPANRDTRRVQGSSVAKFRRLTSFLAEAQPELTKDQIDHILSVVVRPMKTMAEHRSEVMSEEPLRFHSLTESLAKQEKFDPATRLETLKCLVFGSMVNIFKQKPVIGAVHRLADSHTLDDPSDVYVLELAHGSEFGPHYWAGALVADLKVDGRAALDNQKELLVHLHSRGRLLRLPNRKFVDTVNMLGSLGNLYLGIEAVEEALKNLPERISSMRTAQQALVLSRASELAVEMLRVGDAAYKKMEETQNAKMRAAPADGEQVWNEAVQFDTAVMESVRSVLHYLDQTGILVGPNIRAGLEDVSQPRVHLQRQRYLQRKQEAELQWQIDGVNERLHTADSQYVLSNKRMRDRAPELIGLAKVLSDSIKNNAPLTEHDARGLVGLMLGVYWEKTGECASIEEVAQTYLADALHIRDMLTKLKSLGGTGDSFLLRRLNLLDELIDSGMFDNVGKHPEFEVFEDFILAYIIAKDGNTTSPPPESSPVKPEAKAVDTPVVPVEAVGQAEYEDIRVFPPSATATDVIHDYKGVVEEKSMPLIEWERIVKLIEFRDQLAAQNLQVSLIRTKHASWQVLPFFVLEIKLPGRDKAVVVVESPVYGNATYIYREAEDRLKWRDLVQQGRPEAREWGAVPAVHVDSKKLDVHFEKLGHRVISELTVAQ